MSTTEDHQEELQVYEICYLVLPSIPEDNLPQVVSSIQNIVTKAGGLELDSEAPIKRSLAYKMSKTVGASKYVVSDAYIGWLKFEVAPGQVESMKTLLDKLEELLRYLVVKAPRETEFTFASEHAMEAEEGEGGDETDTEASEETKEDVV